MTSEQLSSAALYLAMFSTALVFFGFAEMLKNKAAWIFVFLGCLIPSLMAAFRGETVGVDVLVYAIPNFEDALVCSSFQEVCEVIKCSAEPGYGALIYWLTRSFQSHASLLFMFQLLTIAPIAIAAFRLRDRLSPTLVMVCYLFCYYNNSLNMMRQSVSCAFVILGSVLFLNANWRMTRGVVTAFLAALLFHKSALVGVLGASGIAMWIKRYPDGLTFRRTAMAVAIFAIVFVVRQPVLGIISGINANFQDYFDIFVSGDVEKDDWFIDPYAIAQFVPYVMQTLILTVPFMVLKRWSRGLVEDFRLVAFVHMAFVGWMIYSLCYFMMRSVYGERISLYFDMFCLLAIPMLVSTLKHSRLVSCGVTCFMAVYWFVFVIRLDRSGSGMYILQ